MNQPAASDDELFDEIIADYLDAVADGQHPDEEAILQQNPTFAGELKKFFADHRRMGGLLDVPDSGEAPPSGRTRGAADTPTLMGKSSPAAAHGVDPDQCIADYLLLDKIAEGGMGVVYKAKQLSLNRVVALKMIRAGEFANTEEIQRFHVEAEAAAKLTHPGIVPIYQIGEDKGQHFFSMALVEGSSLADMILDEPMKPRRAAEYVTQVARAVHYAHEQGIIHRDLKPANVLVDKANQPLVTDFGLAKQISSDHELTMSGQILGTASYMSPEQAAGQEVTPLADVYSLGALLYALLAQRPPFIGANPVDILMDVLSKDPATPSSLNITLSRDLETICMHCLEKDPKRRYASALELADDLDRFLDGTPIQARPVGRIEKYIRWCHRKPAVASTLFLSFMLTLVAAAYWVRPDVIRHIVQGPQQQQVADSLVAHARNHYGNPINVPEATTNLDALLVRSAEAMLAWGQPGLEQETLFQELAQALESARVADPNDPQLKSALADCYLSLARMRFPLEAVDRSTGQGGMVSEEQAPSVQRWLDASLGLLMDLLEEYPRNQSVASRAATVQAAMENLPGTGQQRMYHLMLAAELSRTFDQRQGIVRFSVDEPPSRNGAEAGSLQALQEQVKQQADGESRLELAHAYRLAEKPGLAIDEYEEALKALGGDVDLDHLQRTFQDLAILASNKPEVVRFIVEKHWPARPAEFYHAVLGLRLADLE